MVFLLKVIKKLDDCIYIGKGTGHRKNEHLLEKNLNLEEANNLNKVKRIKAEISSGNEVYSRIIVNNLNEEKALFLEEKIISEIGLKNLTNILSSGFFKSGHNNPNSRNSTKEVSEIKWLIENSGLYVSQISKIYEIPRGTLNKIKNEKTWVNYKKIKPKWYNSKTKEEIKKKWLKKYTKRKSELSIEDVKEIKWLLENSDCTMRSISYSYDVSRQTVYRIKNGLTWVFVDQKKKPSNKIKRVGSKIGDKNPNSKLSKEQVKEIKWLLENGSLTQREIADRYGVGGTLIYRIKYGKSRSHIIEKSKPEWI